ncbi:TPA: serine/threonine-protein kinase [Bacillus thuringiensis]|uniref:serine/threonine-protein kinase n=1 Tax=Bacillus thuringiensis TaxID=1428 RepID=UPI00101EA873|nr:serine/threonine-protein kinase [Bacillus thuringiensis]
MENALKIMFRTGNKIGDPSGFGEVFEAKKIVNDIEQPGEYALKQLKQNDVDSIERFKREVRYLTKLNHPRIVKCEGYNVEGIPCFYVMKMYRTSLSGIQSDIMTDFLRIKVIYNNILEGIEYLHKEGYIHRDLKPGNVLLNSDTDLVLCDLGLCVNPTAEQEKRLTRTHLAGGSAYYCSPEQDESLKYIDYRTDIYSFGKMLYETFTGTKPTVLDISQLPPAVQFIVKKCTQYKRENRFNSIEDLRQHFNMSMDLLIEGEHATDLLQVINDVNTYSSIDFEVNGKKVIEKLANAISRVSKEDELHETLMKIKGEAYKELYKQFPDLVQGIIPRFIEYIDTQGWPFSYIDTIADKYHELFVSINNNEIKEKILLSLLQLSAVNNRWYAMGQFTELLHQVKDDTLAFSVYHTLSDEQDYLDKVFRNVNISKDGLHIVLKKLF